MFFSATFLTASLLLGDPSATAATTNAHDVNADARRALAALPGETAFLFTELTEQGPRPLYGIHANERFAVGSSFKLFILGELAAELNTDRRKLDTVTKLRSEWIGPPFSELAQWPLGSPVTLHTLALKMISISDNTATDHLLRLLGREPIEKRMAVMGHAHPEWNRPLLLTREMVMLRDKKAGTPANHYRTLDVPARRKFLADMDAETPNYDDLDFDTTAYQKAEWYATPMDMARTMAWLKKNTRDGQPAHPLRAILAVETKLPHDTKIWPYVGFKGGSEDQLVAGNWLLRHRNGRWYTFHVFCNNPQGKLSLELMAKVVSQVFATVQSAVGE